MTELRDCLQAALGSGYRIEKELGGGGMSRVFLAEEVRLGRRVVVKVLPPEMAAGVSVDRFEREIQLAARLQHPHIVPLLTAGASGDLLYYVMPFIEGESLRAKLARERELPIPDALRILRDVLDALAYAHGHQVVHRDIKPDNVLLSGQHALVTDFGVAKAVAESTGKQTLTSMGVALGTPAYMAPEQATADPYTDHRADIYAVGAMAYEMVTGRPPFMALNAQAMLAAHVTEAPDPVTRHRNTVPEALNQLILRCLAKKPADRWQRADELIPHVTAMLTPTGGTTPTATQPHLAAGAAVAAERQSGTPAASPARVAGLFAASSVVVLLLVFAIVRFAGLPYWVFYGAIALLAIGLPIMLLTSHHERRRAAAPSSGQMEATPSGGLTPYFTWRKALMGGVVAFAGLGVMTTGFMALRALGVGPFATLVSAGVLNERDVLVLAVFSNRTDDSILGAAITDAFRIDHSQSRVVRLLETSEVSAALSRMQHDAATPLTEDLARQVAQREGAKAVVAGDIVPLGTGYVLSVRLVGAGDGRTLRAGREVAAGASEILEAVETLSKKLREGIGESLRAIRAEAPLVLVTTRSLPALRAYSEGHRLVRAGQNRAALTLLEQAVSLDSGFGMAWRGIGVVLNNLGTDRARSRMAVTRAYELSDRMPPLEAAHARTIYYGSVERNREKYVLGYEQLLASWPDDAIALNNLALAYRDLRRFADAERLQRHRVEVQPDAIGVDNLISTLVEQGRLAAAESTLAEWNGRLVLLGTSSNLAREQGQFDRALMFADSMTRREGIDARVNGHQGLANLYLMLGRARLWEREVSAVTQLYPRSRSFTGHLARLLDLATGDAAVLARPDAALQRLNAALVRYPLDSLPPLNRPYGLLVAFYANVGRLDRAKTLLAEYERVVPGDIRESDFPWYLASASVALAGSDGQTAIAIIEAGRERLACSVCYEFDRGRAFEQVGVPDSAIAAYEAYANTPRTGIDGRQFYLAGALRRLGELHEAKGDREKAVEYYGRFVELWKNADPELQPLVSQARERMARLVGER